MASIISITETGIDQLNQWIAGISGGENVQNIANSGLFTYSGSGNALQLRPPRDLPSCAV